MDGLKEQGVPLVSPFLTFDDIPALTRVLARTFAEVPKEEIAAAVQAGLAEAEQAKNDVRTKGEETLVFLTETGTKGILLCGHPYHADPEINHGIADMITGMGLAVLTEDSICHLDRSEGDVGVVNQWTYHARMYRPPGWRREEMIWSWSSSPPLAAGSMRLPAMRSRRLWSATTRSIRLIKIDEISNLGAARIRLRSLRPRCVSARGRG